MKKIRFIFCLCIPLSILTSCEQQPDCTPVPTSSPCICTEQYEPVCGCDKVTYGNACAAKCRGIEVYTSGACAK